MQNLFCGASGTTQAAPAAAPTAWKAGDFFTRPGSTDCYQLAHVDQSHISYVARDGYREGVDDSIWMSLAEKTADWIPATDEQIARYKRLYQPAPENWD